MRHYIIFMEYQGEFHGSSWRIHGTLWGSHETSGELQETSMGTACLISFLVPSEPVRDIQSQCKQVRANHNKLVTACHCQSELFRPSWSQSVSFRASQILSELVTVCHGRSELVRASQSQSETVKANQSQCRSVSFTEFQSTSEPIRAHQRSSEPSANYS